MKKNEKNNKENMTKKIGIIFIIAVLVGISLFYAYDYMKPEDPESIHYNEFIEMVEKDEVKKVELEYGNPTFIFETKDEVQFETDNPRTPEFKEYLLTSGIDEVMEKEGKGRIAQLIEALLINILPLIIMIFFLMTIMEKTIANPKVENKIENVETKFSDIAGNEEAKEDMKFLVKFLKEPQKYIEMGAKLPKGVILYGAPGTGKTLTARAIAGEAEVPFFNVTGSDFIEMYAGLGAKRVRSLFKEAKENAPCIVFIDELDALGTTRGQDSHSEKDQTINALLSEMDGFAVSEGVIVMAATNRVQDLDSALIRPGRFDRHIGIELPEYRDRLQILELHANNKNLGEDVSLEALAKMTIGFSGAALEALLNEATILAVNRDSLVVTMEDIDEAHFKMLVKGNKKKDSDRTERDTRLVAYHEAGHALVAKLKTDNDVPKVTIVPSTSGVGGATFNIPKRMNLLSKTDIENEIMVLYAGRAAEEVLKGNNKDITTGASNDIERATELIKAYFNDYGMSDKYGMIKVSAIEKGGDILDEAIEMSKKIYDKTLQLLKDKEEKLDEIAAELIERETIIEADLDRIIFGIEEKEIVEEEKLDLENLEKIEVETNETEEPEEIKEI